MNTDLLVSIIIPTYGGAHQLERAIYSVQKQTYKNIEIIVVDDNNPETEARRKTERIMKLFNNDSRVIYIKHDANKNGAAARNTGIQASKGDFLCFLDDDDFFLPERVSLSVCKLKDNLQEYDAVLCNVMDCTDSGLYGIYYHYTKSGHLKNELLTREIIMGSGSNIFITRRAAIELKGFDVAFRRLQDDEFMVRFYKEFKATALDKLLIVKSRNGVDNEPKLRNLYESKVCFFDKYKVDIDMLNNDEKNKFYNYHFTALLNSSFVEPDSELKKYIIKTLCDIRPLSKKEKIKLLLMNKKFGYFIIQMYSQLNFMGRKREYNNNLKIRQLCSAEEQKLIDEFISFNYSL